MGRTDSTIIALGVKITNSNIRDILKDALNLDDTLQKISKEKVSPEVKLEFDQDFNKQMQDEFVKLSSFYNKNLSKFNLTKKYSEAFGFGVDQNNSQEDRLNKLKEMLVYSQQLFDLQKSVGRSNDLSILDEGQISKLLKAQDNVIKKQEAYDEALKKNKTKAREIGSRESLKTEADIIKEANAREIRKGKTVSEIASDTAKKYGITDDLKARESRQLLSNYAKTVDLFKNLKKEQSELGKGDLTRVDNAEKYLVASRQVLDVYKQIEEYEKSIAYVFDHDGSSGLKDRLATKTDSKVNKDSSLLKGALRNSNDGAYQIYAAAASKKAESGLNTAKLDFQNRLNNYYQKQAEKTTRAAENIVAKSQKKIDELQSKKAELKESQSSSSSASVVSQADLDLLNKYNLSVDECVEKVKELEEYMTSVSGDNNQSKFDKAEQDQLLYFQRAKELDEEKLRSSLDKDTYEYLDDNADILNKQSKAILDALRNQSNEAATEIKTVQEEIIAGENQVQQEIEESKAAQQEAASTAQIAHEEVSKVSEASQKTVKASEQMGSQKQVEAGVVEAREKIVESVDGLQDKVINFKIEGIEQAKSDLAQVNNILSQIPNEKDIKVSLINSDDAPFLTDPHGNMITAYRGVNDVYGGLFSSDDGFTFFTDSLANGKSYGSNLGGKTYKANLKMKNPLEIDTNGSEWDNIKFLGDPLSEDEVAKRIQYVNSQITNMESRITQLSDGIEKSTDGKTKFKGKEISVDQAQKMIEDAQKKRDEFQKEFDKISDDTKNPYGIRTTDEIARWAKSTGLYDGVIFKNILDSKDHNLPASNVFTVFNQEQIKNAQVLAKETKKATADVAKELEKTPEINKESLVPEANEVGSLTNTIDEVTEAVKRKTQAFEEEGKVVSQIVNDEKTNLSSLADEVNKVANEAEKTTSDTKKKAEINTSKSNKKNNQKKANEDIDSAKAQAKAALARKLKQEKDEQKAIDDQNKLTKQRLINKTKQTKQNLKDQARERAAQQKAEQKESDKIQKEQEKKQKRLEKEQEKSANRESLESGLKDKQIKNLGKLEKFTTDANGSATLRFIGEVDGRLTETTVKVRDFQSALEALKKEESTPGSFAEYANSMTGTKSKDLSGEKKALQTATSIRAKEIAGDVLSQNQVNILNQLRQKYEEIKAKAGEATQAEREFASAFEQMNATAANNAFNKQVDAYNKLAGQSEGMLPGYKERLEEIRSSIEQINNMEINPDESGEIQDISELRSQLQAFSKDVKSGMYTPASESGIESARERLATIMATNTKASSGRFKPQFENLQGIAGSLNVGTTSQLDLEKFNAQISNLKANIDSANKAGASFGSMWKQRMGSLAAYLTTFASFYRIIEIIKDTANTVRELDTAMVELQKVSDASATRLQQSFENSKNTAKELGVTVQETINATADWSRLGYSVDQAEELAKVAVIYKHVGDGIDIDTANESLISTLQGFKMNATEAMEIIDKFNETANNMPIDSAGIGEALQRSAASFHAANTDLSESIALITGANAVVQDPSRVGNMWKTKFYCLVVQQCA